MLLLGIRILNWRAHFFNQVSIKRRWVWSFVLETLTLSFDIKACESGKVSWDKGKKWEEKLSKVIKVLWYWVSEPVEISLNGISDTHFFFKFYFIFNFTILYWFCQISKWICHSYTCVPHPEPSSLLPPHTIPLGRPIAPAPSIQYCASNLDWQLNSYMILYEFQCHSPKIHF